VVSFFTTHNQRRKIEKIKSSELCKQILKVSVAVTGKAVSGCNKVGGDKLTRCCINVIGLSLC